MVAFVTLTPVLDPDATRTAFTPEGDWPKRWGTIVAAKRTAFRMTRADLAGLVGTTEATIARVETGDLNPRDYLRAGIATALGCDVAAIWRYPSRSELVASFKNVA